MKVSSSTETSAPWVPSVYLICLIPSFRINVKIHNFPLIIESDDHDYKRAEIIEMGLEVIAARNDLLGRTCA